MAKFTDKISNLINQQVPEFVLEQHPKFLEFLKTYYTFMESAELGVTSVQTTEGILLETETNQNNELILDGSRIDTDRTQLDAGDKVLLESSAFGKFTRGETITGQTSNATATVLAEDLDNNRLFISAQDKFIDGEEVVGVNSSATAIINNYKPNPVQNIQDLLNFRDPDKVVSNFLTKFRNEFLNTLPETLSTGVDKRSLIKNIKSVYRAKGTNRGHELFFRLLFGLESETIYPRENILRASDGKSTINISSSTAYNDGEFHHYVINKSGSEISLYIDGANEVSSSYEFRGLVNNDRDLLIGSRNVENTEANFSGSIGQLRVHRTGLTDNEISSLANNSSSGSALQRKEVGYVFYRQGVIVTTDPRPRYQNIFLGNGDWDYTNRDYQLDYRATKQVEEVSILCEIKRNEYNVSSNTSLRLAGTDSDTRLLPMVTGSDFRPYITQVGLYNDNGDLLAIGKLGSPLKKRQDVDVTINVKFDID